MCKISGLISPVPYPGILTGILNWIVNSANRSLNFVRRNIKTKITNVRETAYMWELRSESFGVIQDVENFCAIKDVVWTRGV